MIESVDKFFLDGCMRCKYGATSNCKIHTWMDILNELRNIALKSELKEEIKWGFPTYTYNAKNIFSISVFKAYCSLNFFKGVLLENETQLLEQQGNIQTSRIIKFTNIDKLLYNQSEIEEIIKKAIEIEKSGRKPKIIKNPEPEPVELLEFFELNPIFKDAFRNLTSGRQRAYIIHFSQAKQSETRKARIQKNYQNILNGIGFNEIIKLKNKNHE